jgi:hypothetical protein
MSYKPCESQVGRESSKDTWSSLKESRALCFVQTGSQVRKTIIVSTFLQHMRKTCKSNPIQESFTESALFDVRAMSRL